VENLCTANFGKVRLLGLYTLIHKRVTAGKTIFANNTVAYQHRLNFKG